MIYYMLPEYFLLTLAINPPPSDEKRQLVMMVVFAGLRKSASRLVPPHMTLFIHSAEQCFSLTTNQPEQCFSAKFQTSERSH